MNASFEKSSGILNGTSCFKGSDVRHAIAHYIVYGIVVFLGLTINTAEAHVFFSKSLRSRSSIMLGCVSVFNVIFMLYVTFRTAVARTNLSWLSESINRVLAFWNLGTSEQLSEEQLFHTRMWLRTCSPWFTKLSTSFGSNGLLSTTILFLSCAEPIAGMLLAWIAVERAILLRKSVGTGDKPGCTDILTITAVASYSMVLMLLVNGIYGWPDESFRRTYGAICCLVLYYIPVGVTIIACSTFTAHRLKRRKICIRRSTMGKERDAAKVVLMVGSLHVLLSVIPGAIDTIVYVWIEPAITPEAADKIVIAILAVRLVGFASPDAIVYFLYNRAFRRFVLNACRMSGGQAEAGTIHRGAFPKTVKRVPLRHMAVRKRTMEITLQTLEPSELPFRSTYGPTTV